MQRFFEERNPRAQRNAEAMNLAGGSKRDNRGEQQQWEPNVGIEPLGCRINDGKRARNKAV